MAINYFQLLVQGLFPSGQAMFLLDVFLSGKPYPIKEILVVASNPLLTRPNSNKMGRAFESLDYLVVLTVAMNDTSQMADMVMPGAGFLERTEIWEMPSFHYGKPYLSLRNKAATFYESIPDVEFFLRLGKEIGFDAYYLWKDWDEVVEWAFEPTGWISGITSKRPILFLLG